MQKSMISLCLLAAMALLSAVEVSAQSSRQIEVKVVDDLDQPLAEATVLVQAERTRVIADELGFGDKPPIRPHVMATTDAAGIATIDVSDLTKEDVTGPVSVYVLKLGFGMQSASVQKKVALKCWPVRKRTVQIVDDQEKPIEGLRVEHVLMEVGIEAAKLRWWREDPAVTDEFGLATLETHASGQLSLMITEPDGTVHRSSVNDLNRFNGRMPDLRDLTVLRLTPHGKIEGKMPAEFAKDFSVRVMRDFRSAGTRLAANMSSLNSQTEVDPDGNFRFDAVAEGLNWLVVFRREPLGATNGEPPTRQPVALHQIEVQAGETSNIRVEAVPVAKVSGRVVSTDGAGDFADLRLLINKSTAGENENRNLFQQAIDRVKCSSDGSFVCWLPVGRYQLTTGATNSWRPAGPVEFDVGSGAATIATGDLRVSPLKKVNVTWLHDYRMPNSMLGVMDHRLTFRSKERHVGNCTLTADGYGTVYLAADEPVTIVSRDVIVPTGQSTSGFLDRDPSDNFDLELVKTAQGLGTNIAMRGRVVDTDGKGVGRVPVTITLAFEATSNSSTRPSMQTGSQMLDVVISELDGSFQIPPRQLLSRLTVPGRDATGDAKFTFTISTPANPEPIEAQKIIEVKPDAWDATEIEFPDLVVDRPLGGNRLNGQVINAEGQPSAGDLIRLADKRHIVRTLSDREGKFSIEDLAGTTWLLRESDWSVRGVSEYGQPVVFGFDEKRAATATGPWQRMERAKRLQLVKDVLQAVPVQQNPLALAQGRGAGFSDEFYLEADRTFEQLLLLKGPAADQLRLQFVNFWSNLSDEKVQRLAEAMSQNAGRVQLLQLLADRHPSAAAYASVMNAIEYPANMEGRRAMADPVFDQLASVGVKLHLYGALEPHRDKIRQFLEQQARDAAQPPPKPANPALPALPPNMNFLNQERPWLQTCRALLDPEQFAATIGEQLSISFNELSNEERMAQMKDVAIFLQLYPDQFNQLPADRLALSDGAVNNLGIYAPLQALEAVKLGKLSPEMLRIATTAALISGHPDAGQMFRESNQLWIRSDSVRTRMSISVLGMPGRQPDLVWYDAAKRTSPEFGKMAAWHLAYDYLSGRYEDGSSMSILLMRNRSTPQMLGVAYCLMNDFPELSQTIAQRAVPRLLKNTDQEFGQTFTRNGDFSVAAWFEPQATVDTLIKLKKRLDEEQKNQAAGARDVRMYVKENELASLRMTCLRGLLLDEL